MADRYLFCSVCEKRSSLKCGRCQRVAYCSKEHQKLDWKDHKNVCKLMAGKCFEIAEDEKVGRHLVSARYILQGETILEEFPLVTGPTFLSPPVCLGCYKFLERNKRVKCSRCNWPLCSRNCEKSPTHVPECEITSQYKKEKVNITTFGINHPTYKCITVLRCLYLKKWNQAAWDKVNSLESHAEDRKNTERYRTEVITIGEFIPRFFNYHEFSVEEILRMAGIVAVNSFHVPLDSPGFVSIFDEASMIEHSCHANCSQSFFDDGRIIIRASRPIPKGEHLSISYMFPLWPKKTRQEHLFSSKCFLCTCPRCTDPTDMGTNFDSYKCKSPDCDGYIVPHLSEVPLNYLWKCTECEKSYSEAKDLAGLFAEVKAGVINMDNANPESCEGFLTKYKDTLSPDHFFMLYAKMAYLACFEGEKLFTATIAELNHIADMCTGIVDLVSKLVPSDNTVRGVIYLFLYSVLVQVRNKMTSAGEMSETQLNENLTMCRDILKKSYGLLALPEREIVFGSLKSIKDITNLMANTVRTRNREVIICSPPTPK